MDGHNDMGTSVLGQYPHTDHFVDREQEIAQVEKLLARIKNPNPPVVEGIMYFGIPGIGKSRILQFIKALCEKRNMLPVSMDFETQPEQSELSYLLCLADQLERRGNGAGYRQMILEAVRASSNYEEQIEQALSAFVGVLKPNLKTRPFILLFDSCETCTPTLFDWIGCQFLVQLVDARIAPVAVFLASRGPQVAESNWPGAIIRATHVQHVRAFTRKAAKEQLRLLDSGKQYRGDEKEIFRLSAGHPLSNEALLYYLQTLGVQVAQLPRHRVVLAQRLYDEVIRKHVLAGAKVRASKIFEIACIPRRFDPELLERIDPDHPQGAYTADLRELQKPEIHLIHVGKPGYQLETTLRKLMHVAVSIIKPEFTRQTHHRLEELYEGELAKQARGDGPQAVSVLELLYHHIEIKILANEEVPRSAEELLLQKLQAYFQPSQRHDLNQLHQLRDMLEADHELPELLTRAGVNKLIRVVERYIQKRGPGNQISHLTIRHTPPSEFHLTWQLGNQALVPAETIHSAVRFTIDEWRANPVRVGKVAFNSYLSVPAQQFVREGKRHPVLLTTNTMEIPFELVHDGRGFLCMSRPFARQVELAVTPRTFQVDINRKRRALVIGNPTGDLPGAEQEANEIAERLGRFDIQVDRLIGKQQAALNETVTQLISHKYHLIHFAGHGFFDNTKPELSGLRFDLNIPPELMIWTDELKRYLQGPAFVFFSACRAAAAEKPVMCCNAQGRFIHNLAVAALEGGACGCLAPMWEIEDQAGKDFTLAFYDHLLQGRTCGEAVLHARKAVRRHSSDCWASWVLFGDPFTKPFEK